MKIPPNISSKGDASSGRRSLWWYKVGEETERNTWIERQSKARQLREQSDDILARLIRTRTLEQPDFNETIFGLVSGQREKAVRYPNSNLIPYVQARNTHQHLKTIQYLFDTAPKNAMRMQVVSSGWVPLYQYRSHHRAFVRRISRMAHAVRKSDFPVEILFASIEVTIQRSPEGEPMLNLHAHLIARHYSKISRKRWDEYRELVKQHFPKRYMHDSKLEKPAECVKYCFKPAEFDALDDWELSTLYHHAKGLRFFLFYGSLKQFRRDLREKGLKLVNVSGDWATLKIRERKAKLDEKEVIDDWAAYAAFTGIPPEPPEKRPNMLLAVTAPMPRFSRRSEPCVIVRDATSFQDLLQAYPNLQHMRREALQLWDSAHSAPSESLLEGAFHYQGHYNDNCPEKSPEKDPPPQTTAPPDTEAGSRIG